MSVLYLADLVSSFLYYFISLATLQLDQMVRTYQTVRKRMVNLPGQVFVDEEAGVSSCIICVLCKLIIK